MTTASAASRPGRLIPLALFAALFPLGAPVSAQSSFDGVGFLPGGAPAVSRANGISADGLVLVGQSSASGAAQAIRWTRAGGIQRLDIPGSTAESGANAASADGSVIVGYGLGPVAQAYRWSPTGNMGLGHLPSSNRSGAAYSVSADGSVVVGSDRYPNSTFQQAFRWTAAGGMQGLGCLNASGFLFSFGNAVSSDGLVAAGYSSSADGLQGFRWNASDGMHGIGAFSGAGENYFSEVLAASADGSVLVGYSNSAYGTEAFRWNATDGIQSLHEPINSPFSGVAWGVSADGSVAVGSNGYDFVTGIGRAFVWDATNHMRDLQDLLVAQGVTSVAGWTLWSAQAVSANGRVIVGIGADPSGRQQGWIAQLSSPCAVDIDGSGTVNVADFLAFLQLYAAADPRADMTGDGSINVQDFLRVLALFAAGCP
jgi:uncharacterized membrane protein